ncbi:6-hydroxynicotinate 3-monooxygenase [Melia azedarach]|uniref:6-hydroxynicotinate 3-monooxygenase n=1 Tax=Melia azedarach TaxID=155640 RepID=A0ACC1XA08_MELAZ|nr:6-hydroxynicotinate 3-monooxygenase [Melia azedarach]
MFVALQNQATDGEEKMSWVLERDENFKDRQYLSFCISQDKISVKVKAKVLQTDERRFARCSRWDPSIGSPEYPT